MGTETDRTLTEALSALPRDPERGYWFYGRDRKERFFSFAEMDTEAHRRAALLSTRGLEAGARVALLVPEPHEFVLTFLGLSVAGYVPVPVVPQASFKNAEGHLATVEHILRTARATGVFTVESNHERLSVLADRVQELRFVAPVETAFEGDAPAFSPPAQSPEDLCFLQFTSGSTNKPKGVMVSHRNVDANSGAFLGPEGCDVGPDDVGVSWLPLYHDMGLIGNVLGGLFHELPMVIMPTELFARLPRMWLELISKHRGTMSYAPNFAYQLVTKRVKEKDLAKLDLSSWRVAGSGAEPIRAATMRAFAEKFRAAGLRENAVLPSYGMAESTLAITFHPSGTPLRVDIVDAEAMEAGQATPAHEGTRTSVEIVGCGRSFSGHEVRVVGEDTHPLPERAIGQVIARGPSVMKGYYENEEATAETFRDGWLLTGDLGYFADGALHICGRAKDLIIIRGKNYYAHDIEWAVAELPGVRRGNVVAFSIDVNGDERLVIAAEATRSEREALDAAMRREVNQQFALDVHDIAFCPMGALPKTSSGKAQRRKSRALYLSGTLERHDEN